MRIAMQIWNLEVRPARRNTRMIHEDSPNNTKHLFSSFVHFVDHFLPIKATLLHLSKPKVEIPRQVVLIEYKGA